MPSLSKNRNLVYAAGFALYFIAAKGGLYLYFTYHTSPALIWPAAGIGLALVLLEGYGMGWVIFAAHLLASLSEPQLPLIPSVVSSIAHAIEPVIIVCALKRLRFEPGRLTELRNMLLFSGSALLGTLIAPGIIVLIRLVLGPLFTTDISPTTQLLHIWVGDLSSILILTPFILVWYSFPTSAPSWSKAFERSVAFGALIAVNIVLFWTPYASLFGISVVFFIPAVLTWFALRLSLHSLTFAILLTSILGIAGSIIAHPGAVSLQNQLLSDELYLGFVAALYLIFIATVEERRHALDIAHGHNRRLTEALARLSREDETKNEFITTLAHELRNPLASILSAVEVLQLAGSRGEERAKPAELMEVVGAQTRVMSRLLDDLLDVSRISQGKLNLRMHTVDVRSIAAACAAAIENICRDKAQTFTYTPPAESLWVTGDEVRLQQTLMNLLFNASKYTPRGGTIELLLTRSGKRARMLVRDNGIGIEPANLEAILEPFVQMATDTGGNKTGLGIGLALTKRLVELHGGRLWVESEGAGKGSTFTVELDLVDPPSVPPAEKPKETRARGEKASHSILIVDDNATAARGLAILLEHAGYAVSVAISGEKALAAAETSKPDAVILDIGLPDISGYEVAERLRASYGDRILLIALTGYGQPEDKRDGNATWFDHYLVKPVGIHELRAVLERNFSS